MGQECARMVDLKQAVIVPLKGPNYATWKVQCMMALNKECGVS